MLVMARTLAQGMQEKRGPGRTKRSQRLTKLGESLSASIASTYQLSRAVTAHCAKSNTKMPNATATQRAIAYLLSNSPKNQHHSGV